jgi:tRNA pseudouridine38-40 synthase
MRYFMELAYNGTRFNGYQIQPKDPSIQEAIQNALKTILRTETPIVGCGRTDTGVHALQYYAHFDSEEAIPEQLQYALNGILGPDIIIYRIFGVEENAHARFDANSRSYIYYISTQRNPFRQETSYYCPFWKDLDQEKMQEAAQLLLEFEEFNTFCKTKTDAKTRNCDLNASYWDFEAGHQLWAYHVTADRFLRGMIRLIVGMCINVGRGRLSLEEVRTALEQQEALSLPWSAPAKGLYLTDIRYPFIPEEGRMHA